MSEENKIPPTGVRWPVIKIRLDMDEEQMDKLAERVAKRLAKTPPAATEGVREAFIPCPTCGRPVMPTDNYCGRCGGPVAVIRSSLRK